MSSATGPVSEYLRKRVIRLLREYRVVVWYDAERALTSFFQTLELGSATKLFREGGYFRLREETEREAATFRQGEASARGLLVYVPDAPLPDTENLLLPLESLGTRVVRTLREEASMALRDRVPQAQRDEWFSVEGLTLRKLDELARAGTEIGSLAVVFGEATPAQVAWKLLSDRTNGTLTDIEAAKQVVALRDLLVSEFGVRFPENISDATALRETFAERILLYEFLDDLEEIPADLRTFELPEGMAQLARCRELASRLRDSQSLAGSYARWAGSAEARFGLATLEYDAEKLGRYFTFSFEERLALRHVHALANAERWEDAQRWVAAQRRNSFWLRHDKERGAEWRVVELAVDLWLTASEQLWRSPAVDEPGSWMRAYARDADGGWLPDQIARKLAALRTIWLDRPDLGEVADLALSRARQLERLLAERFTDAVGDRPEGLGEVSVQLDVFNRCVAPLLQRNRKVALVLADALRFEMAKELSEMLEDSGGVILDVALATLPTLTTMGMAALVPGAEDGLHLVEQGKRVLPVVKGGALRNLADRRARYRATYGDRVGEITLDRCMGAKPKKLHDLVEQSDLLLLLSQDLDEVGETDRVYRAANLMGQILANLHAGIRRLANAGVQEFVIVADHGFLLREDITDAMKIEKPSGEIVEEHRRCVLGRDLGSGEHHIVLRATDLGLGGDLELAFPRGVNVFKVSGGSLAYLHGGLSIQECLVPVLRYVPTTAHQTSGRPTLQVRVLGKRITNRYFPVTLAYSAADLFDQDQSRRFRIDLIADGESVGRALAATRGYREAAGNAIQLRSGEESTVTMGITGDLEGTGALELRVFDAELGETVTKLRVRYEFAF